MRPSPRYVVGDVGSGSANSPFPPPWPLTRPSATARSIQFTTSSSRPACPQAGDDRPVLRVLPFVQQVDGPVDVAVVIGELQQHGVDFKPAPVVATCVLTVQVRDRRAVDRERMVVERVDEIREHQRRPSRRGGTEIRQPPGEFGRVGLTESTRLRVQVGSPLAFTADRPRRVVSLLGDLAQQGQRAQQGRPHDFGGPCVQVVLEFVEYFTGLLCDRVGLAIVDESAEFQGVSHIGFELGFRGRSRHRMRPWREPPASGALRRRGGRGS